MGSHSSGTDQTDGIDPSGLFALCERRFSVLRAARLLRWAADTARGSQVMVNNCRLMPGSDSASRPEAVDRFHR